MSPTTNLRYVARQKSSFERNFGEIARKKNQIVYLIDLQISKSKNPNTTLN